MLAQKNISSFNDNERKFIVKPTQIVLEATICKGLLTYRMLRSTSNVDDKLKLVYGIEVISYISGVKESKIILDITSKYEIAKKLFDMLYENAITPEASIYIVEDYITELYTIFPFDKAGT